MKYLSLILFLLFTTIQTFAQNFSNEWVDYEKTYYKFKITQDGVYRINEATLTANGIPTQNPEDFQLIHNGVEVPLYVSSNEPFVAADYIEFYGKKNDGAFDTKLYAQASWQLNPDYSLFTDTSAYYLAINPTTTNLRYQDTPNNPIGNLPDKQLYFNHEVTKVFDETFFAGRPNRNLAGIANYTSDFNRGEGWVSSNILQGTDKKTTLLTPHVYQGANDAKFTVAFTGVTNTQANPDHQTQVLVNETTYIDTLYNGETTFKLNFEVPITQIGEETLVSFRELFTTRSAASFATINYPHTFNFEGKTLFNFTLPNNNRKYIEVTNFVGGSKPVLYDLTNNLRIIPIIDNSGNTVIYKFLIEPIAGGESTRTYSFINANAGTIPITNLTPTTFTDYSQPENQGNYIILTHPRLMTGEVNEVEQYKNYRNSELGGGYQAVIVNIEELYDQFSWGIAKHPLAIRNFVNYAFEKWTVDPEYLFLLGKSRSYESSRFNHSASQTAFDNNLVPTYGNHASDVLLSSRAVGDYRPRLATGRVPAQTPTDVASYLNKVIEHETSEKCTKAGGLWRKRAIHISGGAKPEEAATFSAALDAYKVIYEDTLFGGDVAFTYAKTTEGTINGTNFPEFKEFIDGGLNIINFVGHSSGQYWDIDLGPPTDYDNQGKYPFIFSSSCFVGNVHEECREEARCSMAEEYILAPNRGAIGFLATGYFGFPNYMKIYLIELYEQFCRKSYDLPIGNALKNCISEIYGETFGQQASDGMLFTSQEFVYIGDPAVKINPYQYPEYIIEPPDVSFSPTANNLSANVDSFAINVKVYNMGTSRVDSFTLHIERTFPDGSKQIINEKVPAPLQDETFTFYLKMRESADIEVTGINTIVVNIDYDQEIQETCEDNNSVTKQVFIFSDLLVPIYPCNLSIVSDGDLTLRASTGLPLLDTKPYKLEIDTTPNFDSPIFEQKVLNSASGVIDWKPEVDWVDNTVYYWRAAQIGQGGTSLNWKMSSFTYIADSPAGWNQGHYYQLAENQQDDLLLDSTTRTYEYEGIKNLIAVRNNFSTPGPISVQINQGTALIGNSQLTGNCYGGITFVVFAPDEILNPIFSQKVSGGGGCAGRGTYGNVHNNNAEKFGIEFHTDDAEQMASLVSFVEEEIPDGYYVLAYSVLTHRLGTTDPTAPITPYLPNIYSFFENMGIPEIANVRNDQPFIVFGRKGEGYYPSTVVMPDASVGSFETEIEVNTSKGVGTITSLPIGPAKSWGSLRWTNHKLLPILNDTTFYSVIGIKNNGTDTLLLDSITSSPVDISAINANDFPFIKLQQTTIDGFTIEPIQLDSWTVLYEQAGELALDTKTHFVFESDTLEEGQNFLIEVNVANVSDASMDSILIQYTIIDKNNESHIIQKKYINSLAAQEDAIVRLSYSTEGFVGNNTLVIEINPANDQQEKFVFNNVMAMPFFVTGDKLNPVLDVTFDGRHILNGDLVSAQPFISILTKDDSKYLALNDTADFEVMLLYPDAEGKPTIETPISFDDEILSFIPASKDEAGNGNNTATLELRPTFTQDGMYQLAVRAKDRSNNNFSEQDTYKTTFEIITKSMISNVLNYPNPFTSSTRFVFDITGSTIPEVLRIQIMTVSGRVVREIEQQELGTLHIGKNMTEFAWDGTDEFGNPLANGLYLYRVIGKLNGQNMDLRNNETVDKYFKNGIGKMYLMR